MGFPVRAIASHIVNGYVSGLWLLFAYAPPYEVSPGTHPVACPFARFEPAAARPSRNRLHRPVVLSEEERNVLPRLDGTFAPEAALTRRFEEEAVAHEASLTMQTRSPANELVNDGSGEQG